jgi:hypothetical protein
MNTPVFVNLPRVEAGLRYLEPMSGKPRTLEFEPPPGVPRTTAVYRQHTVEIRDVRPVASTLSLDREGFQLLTAPTRVGDFGLGDLRRNPAKVEVGSSSLLSRSNTSHTHRQ